MPPEDSALFGEFLRNLGYRYWDESSNPACKVFLS